MFWNKKEEKALPDLPPIKSPFNKELISTKKEQKDLPKEPEEDSTIDNENEDIEKHSLPSFPDSPIATGFSQAAIKDAINQDEIKENPIEKPPVMPDKIISNSEKKFKTIEVEEDKEDEPKSNPYLSSIRNPSSNTKQKVEKPTIAYSPPYANSDSFSLGPPPEDDEEIEDKIPKSNSQQKSDVFVKIDKFFSAKKALEAIDDQVNEMDNLLKKIRETKMKEERELGNWEKEITMIKSRIQNINDNIFEKAQ